MIRPFRHLAVLSAAAAALGFTGCGAPETDGPALQDDVGAVSAALTKKEDYERAPGGKRVHKSCVHEVPDGATITEDLDVIVDGKKVAHYGKCKFPALDDGPAPTLCGGGSCWVEADQFQAPTNSYGFNWFNALGADWIVPQVPITFANQLIYMFPALANNNLSGLDTYIIQPVLQFGRSLGSGGNYWQMANWIVLGDGTWMRSTPTIVSPGASIHGEMDALWGTCDSNGKCKWGVNYAINGTWYGLQVSPPSKAIKATKGALEAYDSTGMSFPASCSHYPSSGTTNFVNFFASQPGPTADSWNTPTWPGFTFVANGLPNCGFGVSDFAGSNGYDGAAYFGY